MAGGAPRTPTLTLQRSHSQAWTSSRADYSHESQDKSQILEI